MLGDPLTIGDVLVTIAFYNVLALGLTLAIVGCATRHLRATVEENSQESSEKEEDPEESSEEEVTDEENHEEDSDGSSEDESEMKCNTEELIEMVRAGMPKVQEELAGGQLSADSLAESVVALTKDLSASLKTTEGSERKEQFISFLDQMPKLVTRIMDMDDDRLMRLLADYARKIPEDILVPTGAKSESQALVNTLDALRQEEPVD